MSERRVNNGTPGDDPSPGARVEIIQQKIPTALYERLEEIAERQAISMDQLMLLAAVNAVISAR